MIAETLAGFTGLAAALHVSSAALTAWRYRGPAPTLLPANPPLVTDIAKLATDGFSPNSWENTGMSGCVQYMTIKAASVPRNNAEIARQ